MKRLLYTILWCELFIVSFNLSVECFTHKSRRSTLSIRYRKGYRYAILCDRNSIDTYFSSALFAADVGTRSDSGSEQPFFDSNYFDAPYSYTATIHTATTETTISTIQLAEEGVVVADWLPSKSLLKALAEASTAEAMIDALHDIEEEYKSSLQPQLEDRLLQPAAAEEIVQCVASLADRLSLAQLCSCYYSIGRLQITQQQIQHQRQQLQQQLQQRQKQQQQHKQHIKQQQLQQLQQLQRVNSHYRRILRGLSSISNSIFAALEISNSSSAAAAATIAAAAVSGQSTDFAAMLSSISSTSEFTEATAATTVVSTDITTSTTTTAVSLATTAASGGVVITAESICQLLNALTINQHSNNNKRKSWAKLSTNVQQQLLRLLVEIVLPENDFRFTTSALESLGKLSFRVQRPQQQHQQQQQLVDFTTALMQRIESANIDPTSSSFSQQQQQQQQQQQRYQIGSAEVLLQLLRGVEVLWARDVPVAAQRSIFHSLLQQLQLMNKQHTVSVIYSLAKMGLIWGKMPFEVRSQLLQKLQSVVAELDTIALSNTIWSMGKMRLKWALLKRPLREQLTQRLINISNSNNYNNNSNNNSNNSGNTRIRIQALSNIIYGLHKMEVDWKRLPVKLRVALEMSLPANAATTSFAIAAVDNSSDSSSTTSDTTVTSSYNSSSISSSSSSGSTSRSITNVDGTSDGNGEVITEQAVANLISSLGAMGFHRSRAQCVDSIDRLLSLLTTELTAKFTPQGMANTLAGLANMKFTWSVLPAAVKESIVAALLSSNSKCRIERLDSYALSTVLWSFGCLKAQWSAQTIGSTRSRSSNSSSGSSDGSIDIDRGSSSYYLSSDSDNSNSNSDIIRSSSTDSSTDSSSSSSLPAQVCDRLALALDSRVANMSVLGLSSSMNGLAKCGARWEQLPLLSQSSLAAAIVQQSSALDSQALANVWWGVVVMQFPWQLHYPRYNQPADIFHSQQQQQQQQPQQHQERGVVVAEDAVMTSNTVDVSTTSAGLKAVASSTVAAAATESDVAAALLSALERLHSQLPLRSVSQIFYSLAKLNCQYELLLPLLRRTIEGALVRTEGPTCFTGSTELANTLYSLGRMNCRFSLLPIPARRNLFASLSLHVKQMSEQELGNAVWGLLGQLGVTYSTLPTDCRSHLRAAVVAKKNALQPQALVAILTSLGRKSAATWSELEADFADALLHACRKAMESATTTAATASAAAAITTATTATTAATTTTAAATAAATAATTSAATATTTATIATTTAAGDEDYYTYSSRALLAGNLLLALGYLKVPFGQVEIQELVSEYLLPPLLQLRYPSSNNNSNNNSNNSSRNNSNNSSSSRAVVAAVNGIARMSSANWQQLQSHVRSAVSSAILCSAREMQSSELASTLWALALLRFNADFTTATIAAIATTTATATTTASHSTAASISSVFDVATIAATDPTTTDAVANNCATVAVDKAAGESIVDTATSTNAVLSSTTTTAAATVEQQQQYEEDVVLLQELLKALSVRVEEMNGHELAWSLWSLGRLQLRYSQLPQQLQVAAINRCSAVLNDMTEQELGLTLWSLNRLNAPINDFPDELKRALFVSIDALLESKVAVGADVSLLSGEQTEQQQHQQQEQQQQQQQHQEQQQQQQIIKYTPTAITPTTAAAAAAVNEEEEAAAIIELSDTRTISAATTITATDTDSSNTATAAIAKAQVRAATLQAAAALRHGGIEWSTLPAAAKLKLVRSILNRR